MDFSFPSIFASLIFSGIGYMYLSFGRKQANLKFIFTGLVLMGYSYFVDSLIWTYGLGTLVSILPFALRWF